MNSVLGDTTSTLGPLIIAIAPVDDQLITKGNDIMTKIKDTVADKTADFSANANSKAEAAVNKGKEIATKGYEFQKGNVEAIVASGKIGFTGAKDMGKTNIEYMKSNMSEMQSAVKELSTVKSPTDMMKLQGEYSKKGMEIAVDQASKNTEAMIKLMGDMFQPISARMTAATGMVKNAV